MKSVGVEPRVLGEVGLAGVRESVSRARAEVRGWLGEAHPAIDDVVLAVSELVTNAIVHSDVKPGDSIRLTVTEGEEFVGVEVADPGSVFSGPHVRKEENAEDGRGLLIVREISLAWGVRERCCGPGRTVWCAIAIPPPPADPSVPGPLE
ncbi:ATP-binding protein [Streptosporangium sp. NPDC051022]|uniref:ATP-binding protein n=1 Tax=Streptosporangium sp. NPDC051022 TaxID=3155752 RepID=UPI00343FD094